MMTRRHDRDLIKLMSELARVTSDRSATPRALGLRLAYLLIEDYALQYGETEEWCDRVMRQFVEGDHHGIVAQRAA